MPKQNLTLEKVRKIFRYDPGTGLLYRLHANGEKVGRAKSNGYLVVSVGGENYQAHRIAWLLSYGAWPVGDIDHINRIKTDNRLSNLRDVSKNVNSRNSARVKKTQIVGPMPLNGKWIAVVPDHKTSRVIGPFDTHAQASAAYSEAAKFALLYEGEDEPKLREPRAA